MFNLNKETTLCFTGHRSQKLPWKFNEQDPRCLAMKKTLETKLIAAINEGYVSFYSGMALGFDMICAETIIKLKSTYPHIKLYAALPCKTQSIKWPKDQQQRYTSILNIADGIRCIYDDYTGRDCMIERNHFMVDNSSCLIALFDGQPGGTKDTVEYAKNKGLTTVIIKP